MAESRVDNAKRNAISGIINKVVLLLLPFVVRTVLLRKLGAEYLGLSSLFTSVLQVLNMAELGFSSAVTFSLYKPLAEKDTETVCAYLTFFRKTYKVIGVVVIIAGIILMPFTPYLVNGSYPADINLYVLFAMYIINTAFSYLFWGYKAVLLSAVQKQRIISNIDTILGCIKSLLQLLVLVLFKNYYYYVMCLVIGTVLNNICVRYFADKLYPEYTRNALLASDKKKAIAKQVGGLAIGKLSNTARNSFDSIVLSLYCGLVDLAVYSNYYYIISTILGFITVLTEAIAAGIGDSVAVETCDKNYNDFKKFYFLFGWLGSWCTICMVCLYQPFMELWAGENLVVSDATMFLFVIYFYILQSGQLRALYSRAAGIWWEQRKLTIGEAILNLLLNFILGYYYGMQGILLATIITVSLFSIVGVGKMTVNLCFRRSSREFFCITAVYAAITFLLSAGMYFLVNIINLHGFSAMLVNGALCLVIPNIVILGMTMINKDTKRYFLDTVTMILKKRRTQNG